MKKKILFFVDDYSGGAGNVVQLLANYYHANNIFEPVVALLNPHTKGYKLNSDIQVIECSLEKNLSKNKFLALCRNVKDVRRIVKQVNPTGIISFLDNVNTLVCISMFFNKMPIIVSERSNPLMIKPYGLLRHLRPIAYRRANKISVQCACFAKFMPGISHKILITPNPVLQPTHIKTTYKTDGIVNIVSCARLSPVKQFDKMIDAFGKAYTQNPNLRLTIYGEGQERALLEKKLSEEGLTLCVTLPGAVKNVHEKLSLADIYLMTSQQEGFPNALCEAMAVGLPVVAFACHEGLKDIVENEVNGYLVPQDDTTSMANVISQLAANETLRMRIGSKAKDIVNKFSVENICTLWSNEVIKLY